MKVPGNLTLASQRNSFVLLIITCFVITVLGGRRVFTIFCYNIICNILLPVQLIEPATHQLRDTFRKRLDFNNFLDKFIDHACGA